MPGIVGFTTGAGEWNGKKTLAKMQDLVTHEEFYTRDALFCDETVCATCSHISAIQLPAQPCKGEGIYVWMDGEFYNQRELLPGAGNAGTDPEILHALYREDNDLTFLGTIDGIYAAAIYDSNRKVLLLISDRYGLRHLYWTADGEKLAWGSEAKAMLALPDFEPRIDGTALVQFMEIGYLLENRTWFEGVSLLPSGTILAYDLEKKSFDLRRYWDWDRIAAREGKADERELADELGRLFVKAVEARCLEADTLGVMLSGGLDSRAITAAVPASDIDFHALTFGIPDSPDVRIARRIAALKGAQHHVCEIDASNWLQPRLRAVWLTDGQMSLQHMHGAECYGEAREFFSICLNGFAGDLILGGSYLFGRDVEHVERGLIAKKMRCDPALLEGFNDYAGSRRTDFYFLQNRVRRFTAEGARLTRTTLEYRQPFYDNELIDFIYSLPDAVRHKNHIYRLMLIRRFPAYFKRIPWQETGVPLGWPHNLANAAQRARRLKNRMAREANRLGAHFSINLAYTDYGKWIRTEPALSLFRSLLLDEDSLHKQYIPPEQVKRELDLHLGGADRSERLCRYLTLELFLKQVFTGEYRAACDGSGPLR